MAERPGMDAAIEAYLSRVEAELLRTLSAEQVREIVAETRSHLLERRARDGDGSTESLLRELGSAEAYARRFVDDAEPAPVPHRPTLSRLVAQGFIGFVVLNLATVFYGLALLLFAIGTTDMIWPDTIGVWVEREGGSRSVTFGVGTEPGPSAQEVLGRWLMLIGFGGAALLYAATTLAIRRWLRWREGRADRPSSRAAGTRTATIAPVVPLLSLLVTLGMSGSLAAQAPGAMAGRVLDEDGGAASYALVSLHSADDTAAVHVRALTDGAGRYVLEPVAAGRYVVSVNRIGYEPFVSEPFTTDDARTTLDLRVRAEPVEIEGLVIGDGRACHALEQLPAAAPRVARLWAEAVKGIEIKQAFLRGHGRTVDLRIETRQDNRVLRDVHRVETRTVVVPDSEVPAAPDAAAGDSVEGGFGESRSRSFRLSLPSESLLTERDLLDGYCVEADVSRSGDGALGLHFRPIDDDAAGVTVEGAVFIEESDYRLRGITYRYFDGNDYVGTGSWEYGNVAVPGDVLRLPVHGRLWMDPPGTPGLVIRQVEFLIRFDDYRDFHPIVDAADAPPHFLAGAAAVVRAAPVVHASVWPGFWPDTTSFLFYSTEDSIALLVSDGVAPEPFAALHGAELPQELRGRAYLRRGLPPGLNGPFHTGFEVGDTRLTAIPWPNAESVEEVLALLYHETFHTWQHEHFDASSTDYFIEPSLLARPEYGAMAEVERRMLIDALTMAPARLADHLRAYLAVRHARLAGLPDSARAIEAGIELAEGSAALVGHGATLAAVGEADRLPSIIREQYLERPLDEHPGGLPERLVRWRVYGTGMAIGALLDRLGAADWRARMQQGAGFDELLARAVRLDDHDTAGMAAAALEAYGYADLLAESAARGADAPALASIDEFRARATATLDVELPIPMEDGELAMDLTFASDGGGFVQIEPSVLYIPVARPVALELPYGSIVIDGLAVVLDMRAVATRHVRMIVALPSIPRTAAGAGLERGRSLHDHLRLAAAGLELRVDLPVTVDVQDGAVSIRSAAMRDGE